jgi:TrmH family RNA methyltransferase
MGLGRLVLVAPHRFDQVRAAEMAVHAADVVDHRSTVSSVREAVADCGLVVGTTSRPSAVRRGALTARVAAREIVAACVLNEVALLFGPEDHGLSADELKLCHRVASIPASGEYASLNLAQAVLLFAYEMLLAAREGYSGGNRVLAPGARTELMYTKLEEAFRSVGFLHAGNIEHMMRTIRRILGRSGLSEHDVRVFLAMARRVRWAGSRPAQSKPGRFRAAGCRGQRDTKTDTTGCDR